jgi:hypothetical protein
MTVRRFFALAAVFGVGWAVGRVGTPRSLAHAETAATPAPSARAEPESCTDRLAMEANANLVGQVQEYKGLADRARQRATEAELRAAKTATTVPARLVIPREEWARMAREGTIRVQLPCASWDAPRRYGVRKPGSAGIGSGTAARFETGQRAAASGLLPEELETLADAYRRAHARTWTAMKPACEANDTFRETMAENGDDEMSDEARIEHCRNIVLDVDEVAPRVALTHVAELRAAGASIERASTDEQRIAFALTGATSVLYEEMTRAVGQEKAVRAIDHGVFCLAETMYDLRDANDG